MRVRLNYYRAMLSLLQQGQFAVFAIILFAIIFSLTCHEFGHAASARLLGDDTAERAGRLTLNPIAHIDPMGLLMVVMLGFGYAKPVPVHPGKLRKSWGHAAVSFAGPAMNLLLAIVSVNLLVWGEANNSATLGSDGAQLILIFLAQINLLLMLFNLIPLGPLDGHYIMEWLLPPRLSHKYSQLNRAYGSWLFIGLIVLSIMGIPIFRSLMSLSQAILPYITFV